MSGGKALALVTPRAKKRPASGGHDIGTCNGSPFALQAVIIHAVDLRAYVLGLMERKGMSRNELGRKLGHENAGAVSSFLSGKRNIPPSAAPAWADALGLDEDERARFIEAALAGTPMQSEVRQLRERVAQEEEKTRERDERIAALLRRLEALESKAPKRR